ncbi:MAG: tripartite tricarboxylate transporter permease [Planctomycetota bacterium]|jgi:putative tricarboxylic transport membrane protein
MNWTLVLQEWKLLPDAIVGVLSSPVLIMTLVLGGLLGMIVGMLPGISAVMAMSLLLGLVFQVPADVGLGLLVAIYVGAIAAGGVTAIMINIPGTPAAAATVMDGFPMAKMGRAKEAVEASFNASFVGGMLGAFITLLLLPCIAVIALKLGDWEIFLVALLGVMLAGALAGKNPLKGWISATLGLIVAMVGMEDIWAYPRFGYTPELIGGINFVPALIGLFGLTEIFSALKQRTPYKIESKSGRIWPRMKLIRKHLVTIVRSVLAAVGIGIVPGVGESAACWLGYDLARRHSPRPDDFGHGEVKGVIAAESANNATAGGALIPTLVFGIPGSGPTAILLAGLFMYGIIISPYFIRILSSPREILLPIAGALGVLGAWAAGFTLFDVYCMFAFGVVGFILRQRDFPLAPMVLGVLVGRLADTSLRRALLTYSSDITGMLTRPIGLILMVLIVVTAVSQGRSAWVRKKSKF